MKTKYEKINFEIYVNNSKSIRELCRNMGMCETGRNFYTMKKYILKYEIDTSHFLGKDEQLKYLHLKNKIPLEHILVKNSTYNNSYNLKKRLIKEGVLEYKCKICKNIGEWDGKPLNLQLDHINGIKNDNRLENLRILCPNCHSQTSTYAGKKRCKEAKMP